MTKLHLLLQSNVGSKEPSTAKTLLRKQQLKGGILPLGQKYQVIFLKVIISGGSSLLCMLY